MTAGPDVVTFAGVSMRIGVMAAFLLVLASGGCGGDGGGGGQPTPTVHTIIPDDQNMLNPGDSVAYGPFMLPADAPLTYTITNTPTGASDDTFKVTIADDASFQSGAPVPVATTVVTGSASGMTNVLPAGSYDLIVVCVDSAGRCSFSVQLTAVY